MKKSSNRLASSPIIPRLSTPSTPATAIRTDSENSLATRNLSLRKPLQDITGSQSNVLKSTNSTPFLNSGEKKKLSDSGFENIQSGTDKKRKTSLLRPHIMQWRDSLKNAANEHIQLLLQKLEEQRIICNNDDNMSYVTLPKEEEVSMPWLQSLGFIRDETYTNLFDVKYQIPKHKVFDVALALRNTLESRSFQTSLNSSITTTSYNMNDNHKTTSNPGQFSASSFGLNIDVAIANNSYRDPRGLLHQMSSSSGSSNSSSSTPTLTSEPPTPIQHRLGESPMYSTSNTPSSVNLSYNFNNFSLSSTQKPLKPTNDTSTSNQFIVSPVDVGLQSRRLYGSFGGSGIGWNSSAVSLDTGGSKQGSTKITRTEETINGNLGHLDSDDDDDDDNDDDMNKSSEIFGINDSNFFLVSKPHESGAVPDSHANMLYRSNLFGNANMEAVSKCASVSMDICIDDKTTDLISSVYNEDRGVVNEHEMYDMLIDEDTIPFTMKTVENNNNNDSRIVVDKMDVQLTCETIVDVYQDDTNDTLHDELNNSADTTGLNSDGIPHNEVRNANDSDCSDSRDLSQISNDCHSCKNDSSECHSEHGDGFMSVMAMHDHSSDRCENSAYKRKRLSNKQRIDMKSVPNLSYHCKHSTPMTHKVGGYCNTPGTKLRLGKKWFEKESTNSPCLHFLRQQLQVNIQYSSNITVRSEGGGHALTKSLTSFDMGHAPCTKRQTHQEHDKSPITKGIFASPMSTRSQLSSSKHGTAGMSSNHSLQSLYAYGALYSIERNSSHESNQDFVSTQLSTICEARSQEEMDTEASQSHQQLVKEPKYNELVEKIRKVSVERMANSLHQSMQTWRRASAKTKTSNTNKRRLSRSSSCHSNMTTEVMGNGGTKAAKIGSSRRARGGSLSLETSNHSLDVSRGSMEGLTRVDSEEIENHYFSPKESLNRKNFWGHVIGGEYRHVFDGNCPVVAAPAHDDVRVTSVNLDSNEIMRINLYYPATNSCIVQSLGASWRFMKASPVGFLVSDQEVRPGKAVKCYYVPKPLSQMVDCEGSACEAMSVDTNLENAGSQNNDSDISEISQDSETPETLLDEDSAIFDNSFSADRLLHNNVEQSLCNWNNTDVVTNVLQFLIDPKAVLKGDLSQKRVVHNLQVVSKSWAMTTCKILASCQPSPVVMSQTSSSSLVTQTPVSNTQSRIPMSLTKNALFSNNSPQTVSIPTPLSLSPYHIHTLCDEDFRRFVTIHPSGFSITKNSCRHVYGITNATSGDFDTLVVTDLDYLAQKNVQLDAIMHTTQISLLCSSLKRLRICPNLVKVHSVFESSHAPCDVLWSGESQNKRSKAVQFKDNIFCTSPFSSSTISPSKKVGYTPKYRYHYVHKEYCEGGDLESFVRKQVVLSKQMIQSLFFQIAFSMYTCRDQLMLRHHDLKLLNFLLSSGKAVLPEDDHATRRTESQSIVHYRVGFGPIVFSLPLHMSNPGFVKLADFRACSFGKAGLGDPITVQQFGTLENTPPEFLFLGSDARQSFASDTFSLGLCFLHLLTGHEPYDVLLNDIRCPKPLLTKLQQIWMSNQPGPFQVIREVIEMLPEPTNPGEVKGAILYDTLYRYLVLFAPEVESGLSPEYASRAMAEGYRVDHKTIKSPVWSAIQSCLFPQTQHRSSPRISCCAQFKIDCSLWSFRSGQQPIIKSARETLSLLGGMSTMERLTSFDPSDRCTMHDLLLSPIFLSIYEELPKNRKQDKNKSIQANFMHYHSGNGVESLAYL